MGFNGVGTASQVDTAFILFGNTDNGDIKFVKALKIDSGGKFYFSYEGQKRALNANYEANFNISIKYPDYKKLRSVSVYIKDYSKLYSQKLFFCTYFKPSIKGMVTKNNDLPMSDTKVMILSKCDSNLNKDSSITNLNGEYVLRNLGDQINETVCLTVIKVIADTIKYPDYIPTYYGNVVTIQEAALIYPQCDTLQANIAMTQLELTAGSGEISGKILVNQSNVRIEGSAIPPLTLILMNENNKPVRYANTKEDGSFSLHNLGSGRYKIWLDLMGIDNTKSPEVSIESTPLKMDFILRDTRLETIVTGFNSLVAAEYFQIFPNPLCEFINFKWNTPKELTYDVSIRNTVGQILKSSKLTTVDNKEKIYIGDLPKGMYFVHIYYLDQTVIKKVFIE